MSVAEVGDVVEVAVVFKVKVAAVEGSGFRPRDLFTHEIVDALTPNASLCSAMLEDAGLDLVAVSVEPP